MLIKILFYALNVSADMEYKRSKNIYTYNKMKTISITLLAFLTIEGKALIQKLVQSDVAVEESAEVPFDAVIEDNTEPTAGLEDTGLTD